jgi:hypothetical protein
MRTMAYKFLGDLVLMVHNKTNPADAELRAYFDELRTKDVSSIRVMVFTDGGGLSASQRKELNAVLAGRQQMCAVISDDGLVRGIVTALSWFNRGIKFFPTNAGEEAFKYLKIPSRDYAEVWREVHAIRSLVEARHERHGG